jgi:hypothetical protein
MRKSFDVCQHQGLQPRGYTPSGTSHSLAKYMSESDRIGLCCSIPGSTI